VPEEERLNPENRATGTDIFRASRDATDQIESGNT
jgi:hypothetical protein